MEKDEIKIEKAIKYAIATSAIENMELVGKEVADLKEKLQKEKFKDKNSSIKGGKTK